MKAWRMKGLVLAVLFLTVQFNQLSIIYADTSIKSTESIKSTKSTRSTENTKSITQEGNSMSKDYSLEFGNNDYTVESIMVNNKTVAYRAYEKIVYVKHPIDIKYQCMNIYIPEEYFDGKSVNNFTAETAPIFLPNKIGGYMPAEPGSPAMQENVWGEAPEVGQDINQENIKIDDVVSKPNAALLALSKGYIVASPGARGRTTQDENGVYIGKAPAVIVDLKAAVRYLRYNDKAMPGNAEKIISNGTSAGGALSSLLGATGNNVDYEPYLVALGAADEKDDIFAASCYCPIINLENADMAYEWQFNKINNYNMIKFSMVDGKMTMTPFASTLSDEQIGHSDELKKMFTPYLNNLGLTTTIGTVLSLNEDGNGSFKEYIESYIVASAQKALGNGEALSELTWMTIKDEQVVGVEFDKYVEYTTRMKATLAFDGLDLSTGENQLFGTSTVDQQHFTKYGMEHSAEGGKLADEKIIKLMNPMHYIGAKGTTTAKYWRIRHGSLDRDTSLAIPVILSTTLENKGFNVDFAIPWGEKHGGDYDLDELFAWMDSITGIAPSDYVSITASMTVDGKVLELDSYNIKGNHYFKMSDIARVINNTEKQFEVALVKESNRMNLTSKTAYTATDIVYEDMTVSDITLYLDGKVILVKSYELGEGCYFNLRDVAKAIGFNVYWNKEEHSIDIDTSQLYSD